MKYSTLALSALAAITGAVSPEALKAAVLARVPTGSRELNERALEAGLAAGAKISAEKEATPSEIGREDQD